MQLFGCIFYFEYRRRFADWFRIKLLKLKKIICEPGAYYLNTHNNTGFSVASIYFFNICKNDGATVGQPWLLQIGNGDISIGGTQSIACKTTKRLKALLLVLSSPYNL